MSFLLYGASGYTGKLTAEYAIKKGLKPVLAGRSEAKIKPVAEALGLEYRIFGLDNPAEAAAQLAAFPLVLNCAGPFSRTAIPMVEACLLSKIHYLDITGEIGVFERVKAFHQKAQDQHIILLSGVGFDVVPTDCMAGYLHTLLPDATHLELAFASNGGISHGTLTTMVENLGESGAARIAGRIVPEPIGHIGKMIDFGAIKRFCMSIPWGDVSTAYHTTGIPNIRVLMAAPKTYYTLMKLQGLLNPILRTSFVKRRIQRRIDEKVSGPTSAQIEKGKSLVWGQVTNASGRQVEARLTCREGYGLTAEMSLIIVQKILADPTLKPGYHTPAELFGHSLILETTGAKFS